MGQKSTHSGNEPDPCQDEEKNEGHHGSAYEVAHILPTREIKENQDSGYQHSKPSPAEQARQGREYRQGDNRGRTAKIHAIRNPAYRWQNSQPEFGIQLVRLQTGAEQANRRPSKNSQQKVASNQRIAQASIQQALPGNHDLWPGSPRIRLHSHISNPGKQ